MVSDTPYDYLTLYANARMVYTDLVHATIVSLMYGTPVRYYYVDERSQAFYSLKGLKETNHILTIDQEVLAARRKEIEKQMREVLKVQVSERGADIWTEQTRKSSYMGAD